MRKVAFILPLIIVSYNTLLFAQSHINNLYQYNYSSIAPMFAGQDGSKVTFLAGTFAPKGGGNAWMSTLIGFETKLEKISSGIGVNASLLQLPVERQTYYNLLYNYSLKVGENKLTLGTNIGLHQRTIDYNQFIAIDSGDPLLNALSNTTTSTLNLGVGGLYKSKNSFLGLSVDNILGGQQLVGQLWESVRSGSPQLKIIAGIDAKIASWLSSTHSLYVVNTGEYTWVDSNNSFLIKDRLIIGLNFGFNADFAFVPRVNGGVKLGQNGKIVASIYSEDYNRGSSRFQGQIMMMFNLP